MSKTITKPTIKTIGIAGQGGIGGFVSALLFDYGAKRNQFNFTELTIDLYDDDLIDASNLLHQNFTDEDIGKYKVDIAVERCGGLVTGFKRFMTKKDFNQYDVIFSCVDSMTFRKDLYFYGFEHPELFWIDGRCSSRQIGLYHSKVPQKSLEASLSDSKERTGCLREVDKKNQVSHVTPQIIAGMMVQTYLNHLRGELQDEKTILMI
jgi:molybdopterin/thiamine biosynthesis adenylyltransferase